MPIKIIAKFSVLFVVTDWVDIRILPYLTDKIFDHLYHDMAGFCMVLSFVHCTLFYIKLNGIHLKLLYHDDYFKLLPVSSGERQLPAQ